MNTLAAAALSPHDITLFLLSVGVLLFVARLLGEVSRMLGQPSVLGEILAGVLLGPTLLGAVSPEFYTWMFPVYVPGDGGAFSLTYIGLEALVTLSAVLLLLVAGLEVDLSTVWRQGKAMVLVSLLGMVIPFGCGFALAWYFPGVLGHDARSDLLPFALFVGIALSITALPVIAKILMDLHMAKSEVGGLIMSSAMINDLVGWIGFAMVLAMMQASGHGGGHGSETAASELVEAVSGTADAAASSPTATVGTTILMTLGFIAVVLTVVRYLFHKSLPFLQAHFSWPGAVLVLVFVLAMLASAMTEWIGIHSIFGAFILGVAAGDSDRLTHRTRETIHQFISNIFAPLFFASIGLRVSFIEAFDLRMVVIVLVVASVGKIIGCYLGAKLAGMSHRVSWGVGFGMVGRGAMEIILGQLAYSQGLIGEDLLVAIIIMALLTSMMSGPGMQWLLKRKEPPRLANAVEAEGFVPRLSGRDREAVIRELASAAAKVVGSGAGKAEVTLDEAEIARAVMRRERLMSTGLRNGLAVPHARMGGLSKPVVVVGVSEVGVDFDSMDGDASTLICLLLTPADDAGAQITLLDMVARAFLSPAARSAAREATSFTQFKAALNVTQSEHPDDAPDAQTPDLPPPPTVKN